MELPHSQPTVGHLIRCLLKCQQWFACSVVLGSKLPCKTQETDVPLWYTAQWGGDELRDLYDTEMKRNGKKRAKQVREEQVTKRKAGTAMTGELICGSEREREKRMRKSRRLIDREAQDITGGGVLSEFELIRQQNSSPVRFSAVSSSNVRVQVCVPVRGCQCLWWEVRGDWWFTEERWWVIHLRQTRQSPWQHEWPVICHPAQRPPLCSSVGWDIYTPSAFLLQASPCISLNCEVILKQSTPVCLLDCKSGYLHFRKLFACPSHTSITFSLSTTHSDVKWEDMPGNISPSNHTSKYLN